jgi:hypothetical protein
VYAQILENQQRKSHHHVGQQKMIGSSYPAIDPTGARQRLTCASTDPGCETWRDPPRFHGLIPGVRRRVGFLQSHGAAGAPSPINCEASRSTRRRRRVDRLHLRAPVRRHESRCSYHYRSASALVLRHAPVHHVTPPNRRPSFSGEIAMPRRASARRPPHQGSPECAQTIGQGHLSRIRSSRRRPLTSFIT